jgi:hypothetical protein
MCIALLACMQPAIVRPPPRRSFYDYAVQKKGTTTSICTCHDKLELIPHDLIFMCMHFFLETLQSYALGCMHACMSRHGHMLDCPSTHTWAFLDDEYS